MAAQYLLNAGYSPVKQWLPQWFQNINGHFDQLPRPPVLTIAGHDIIDLTTETRFYWMTLAALAFVVVAARGLRSSRTGRVLIAVRDNERSAEAYSVSVRRTLILAFVITGFVTGIAGALFQLQQQSISVKNFDTNAGLQVFAMVVVGGLGSIGGAVIGAVYVFGAQYFLPPEWSFLATGAGMLLVLLLMPGGLGAAFGDARDGMLRWYAKRKGIRVPSLVADTRLVSLPPESADLLGALADAATRPETEELAGLRD
jgi:branched-chain amino acid transport system permease protein